MAATGWSYYVPYQPDIAAALGSLRNDVFRRGDYSRPGYLGGDESIRDVWKDMSAQAARRVR